MKIVVPDYSNCGINVVSSIMHYFDADCSQSTHPLVDAILKKKKYKNVVLFLFDGMGVDVLQRFREKAGFLYQKTVEVMTAVYPSTTTAATTSIECGMAPVEHAWLGWTLFFDEIQKAVDVFINCSNGEPAADYHVGDRYIPRNFVFERINRAGQAKACCISKFVSDVHVDTLDELFDKAKSLCGDNQRRYIYAYWDEPDHTMHEVGCKASRIGDVLGDIAERVKTFCNSVGTDTLVLVTADHGLIDEARHHYVEDHPRMMEMLHHAPTMEARAVSFHVKEEYLESFPLAFREAFGENFLLMRGRGFIDQYLGGGEEHPKVKAFVGDYIALAIDRDCICKKRSDFEMKGVHAGLTEQEMLVPLIIAKK